VNALAHPAVSIDAFENATLDAEAFDHESHVHVAWLYLEQWPLIEATDRFCKAIHRLTIKLGAETKYHETITCFFMQLINERRQADAQAGWLPFRSKNIDLISDAGKTLARYYSKELLGSDLARQQYLLPDRVVAADV
jgi:N-formylglutamate deformylase